MSIRGKLPSFLRLTIMNEKTERKGENLHVFSVSVKYSEKGLIRNQLKLSSKNNMDFLK